MRGMGQGAKCLLHFYPIVYNRLVFCKILACSEVSLASRIVGEPLLPEEI